MTSPKTALKILVAEDNQVNQLMAQGTLSHLGHDVSIVENGREALQSCQAQAFDIVLMDLMMPVMDGYESSRSILEHCRQSGSQAPYIIAVTATLTEEDKERCREHGMTHWLNKPLDPDEFQALTAQLQAESQESSTPAPPSSRESIQAKDLLSRVKDPKALQHIVELFQESYPLRIAELEKSLNPENGVVARRDAHTLKGNFLNFASASGAAVAQRLEQAIEHAEWEQARQILPELEAECRSVEQALLALLSTQQGSRVAVASPEEGPGKGFTVLVADVDPANRALCVSSLQSEGYRVLEASDGEQVLEMLQEQHADVVMLSVFMSKMGGFETCRRLKSDEATGMIPVLLVTALDDRGARLSGMDAGADDFITKPIDPREVSLRVRNAARGKGLYDQLQQSFEELKRLEELRDGLTHMLVHDLRTPLTAIKGYASLMVAGFGDGMTPQQKNFAKKIVNQSNRLVDMVSAILDVSRLESDQMPLDLAKADLSLLLYEQGEQFSGLPDCQLELEIADSINLRCDAGLVGRVVANLLSNAFKYTPKGETVTLKLSSDEAFAKVEVLDKGPGVPPEARAKIFEKFTQVEGETHKRPYSSGLGLTFCQLVIQKHGGEIAVGDAPGGGSCFWFTLPTS